MTGPGGALVLRGNPDIDEVLEYVARPQRYPTALWASLRQLRGLRRRGFDVGVCLNPDSWDALLLGFLGVGRSIGFVEPARNFLLDQPFVWDEAELKARQERFDDVLRALGVEPTCRHYSFAVGDAAPTTVSQPVQSGALVIAPGGARNPAGCAPYRQWLPERWVQLISGITDERSGPVVLIGDGEDVALSRGIVAALPDAKRALVHDLTGQTSLEELAKLLSTADLLVTNDSAPVWIAAAVDCPTVAVFGCNHPVINAPLAKWYAAVSCDLPCHPCYRGDSVPTCALPPACVSAVTVSDVMAAVLRVLAQSSRERHSAQEARRWG